MAKANNWADNRHRTSWSNEVFRPESMSQDCYLWSSVLFWPLYQVLIPQFPWGRHPKGINKVCPSSLPNQKTHQMFLYTVDTSKGWHGWTPIHWHRTLISMGMSLVTRGTLTFIVIFVRDSIFIHDSMSLRALVLQTNVLSMLLIDWLTLMLTRTGRTPFRIFFRLHFCWGNLSNFLFTKDAHQWSSSVMRCNDSSTNWISVERTGAAGRMALTWRGCLWRAATEIMKMLMKLFTQTRQSVANSTVSPVTSVHIIAQKVTRRGVRFIMHFMNKTWIGTFNVVKLGEKKGWPLCPNPIQLCLPRKQQSIK